MTLRYILGKILINFYFLYEKMVKSLDPSHSRSMSHTGLPNGEEDYLQELSLDQQGLTSEKAIASVHNLCRNKRKEINKIRAQANLVLKICKECSKWDRIKSIQTCQTCGDHYHSACHSTPMPRSILGEFLCEPCINTDRHTRHCAVCKKTITKKKLSRQCQSCHYDYHQQCFQKSINACKRCAKIKRLLPARHKSKMSMEDRQSFSGKQKQLKINDMFGVMVGNKGFGQNRRTLPIREGRQFVALDLLQKDAFIDKYKKQLLEAISAKHMNYSEQLIDIEVQLKHSDGNSLDFGLSNMSKAEEKQYLSYKQQPIGPFLLRLDPKKGYDVVADAEIPKHSIICEYVGEVITFRECIELERHGHNDSIMDLWTGRNSDQTLVIRPQKWTNIARFLNGVGRNKENRNVDSRRLCFRGRPVVLLVANRKISKGESLCYDYNGGEHPARYPTAHFV